MKAEDIELMWLRYRPVTPWSALSQHAKGAFAALCRACEQHGIERAKELARINEDWDGNVESEPVHTIDWSALDAEIEKENET